MEGEVQAMGFVSSDGYESASPQVPLVVCPRSSLGQTRLDSRCGGITPKSVSRFGSDTFSREKEMRLANWFLEGTTINARPDADSLYDKVWPSLGHVTQRSSGFKY